jgi:hypothetical protein
VPLRVANTTLLGFKPPTEVSVVLEPPRFDVGLRADELQAVVAFEVLLEAAHGHVVDALGGAASPVVSVSRGVSVVTVTAEYRSQRNSCRNHPRATATLRTVLPAWATIVIAAVSALAGIAGGVAVTLTRIHFDRDENATLREHERERQERQLQHERNEQWVERLVRAAEDFSTGVEQAVLGIRNVIATVSDNGNVDQADAEAKRRVEEAVARVARIKLLFKADSRPAQIAADLLPELDVARAAATRTDTLVWDKLSSVYNLHADFMEAAFDIISSPRWSVGKDLTTRYRVESDDTPAARLSPP